MTRNLVAQLLSARRRRISNARRAGRCGGSCRQPAVTMIYFHASSSLPRSVFGMTSDLEFSSLFFISSDGNCRDRSDLRLLRNRCFSLPLSLSLSRWGAYMRMHVRAQSLCRNLRFVEKIAEMPLNRQTMPNCIGRTGEDDLAASVFKTRVSVRARSQSVFRSRRATGRRLERADRASSSHRHRKRTRFRMETIFSSEPGRISAFGRNCRFIFQRVRAPSISRRKVPALPPRLASPPPPPPLRCI
jgi:hypothetical protein